MVHEKGGWGGENKDLRPLSGEGEVDISLIPVAQTDPDVAKLYEEGAAESRQEQERLAQEALEKGSAQTLREARDPYMGIRYGKTIEGKPKGESSPGEESLRGQL